MEEELLTKVKKIELVNAGEMTEEKIKLIKKLMADAEKDGKRITKIFFAIS